MAKGISEEASTKRPGIIRWFAGNHVAANLLMLMLLLGGAVALLQIRQEVYPSFQLDFVDVEVAYPGATPTEIETGVIFAIEEAVRTLTVAGRVEATASEGMGSVLIELAEGADRNRALQDITSAVSRIASFPEETEEPVVAIRDERTPVYWLAIAGPLTERQLFQLAERMRRDLLAKPNISQIDITPIRSPEITFEIPQAQQRALGLSLEEIAELIRENALNAAGGTVRTSGGDIVLRTQERRDAGSAYGDIPLVTGEDGSKVLLRDVATIRDGFEDIAFQNFYNGGRGTAFWIYQNGDEKPLEIAETVQTYLEELRPTLPEGVVIDAIQDQATQYDSRITLLIENGLIGLVFVMIVLGLFLEARLAFWVAAGIPTTLIGALLLLPLFDASVNMISLFGFIVTLGIVVDDAVIVGENIFHKINQGTGRMDAAIEGAREMVVPVLFAVGTNIIAFLPLLFVPGETGRFFAPLPAVVTAVFLISIIEALLILPAHIGRGRRDSSENEPSAVSRIQRRFSEGFENVTDRFVVPAVRAAIRHRPLTIAIVSALVGISIAYGLSGRIPYSFSPVIAGLRVDAEVQTAPGAPFGDTVRVAQEVEAAGLRAAAELGGADEVLKGRMNVIGRLGENWADVNFILVEPENRDFDQAAFAQLWREEIGELPGLDALYFEWEEGPSSGSGLTIELSHPDPLSLEAAAEELASTLAQFDGVTDVRDGFASGNPTFDVELLPGGRALGLTADSVTRQIRHAFFGAEALRLQRGRHETRVMIKNPEAERRRVYDVENLIIRTPNGGEALLTQIAKLQPNRAFTEIIRIDGRRVLAVTSNVVPEIISVSGVRAAVETNIFPELRASYPELEIGYGGRQREESRAMNRLSWGLGVSVIVVFGLLASLLRSYGQAFIVLSAIPVAGAAAILGHIIRGADFSVVSLFGIIALGGLAINGSYVLADEFNRLNRGQNIPIIDAAVGAARRRFRPIFLTSVTTFAGLSPMIFETDPQALFLVPMAIALGFGTLLSGLVIIFVLPCLLVIHAIAVANGKAPRIARYADAR